MYKNVTQNFINVITSTNQTRKFKADVTYRNVNGETVTRTFTQDKFVAGSFSLEMSCMANSGFNVGGTVAQDLSIQIYNPTGEFNGCRFQGGVIKPHFGVLGSDGEVNWCPLGTFIVDEAGKSYDRTIQLKAVDQLLKFEKSMDGFKFSGTTLKSLLEKMCSDLKISCNSDFINSEYVFNEFNTTDLTYRDVLGFIAAAAGGFARMSKDDTLEIVSFKVDKSDYLEISPLKTRVECDIDEPISIDSVAYSISEGANILIGEGNYSLLIENNVLFDSIPNLNGLLNSLYNRYNGFTYYPFSVTYAGDPRLEPGDTVLLTKTVEGDVYSFVDKQKLSLTSFSSLETPVCDTLDKNFMDSYKTKQTASSGGSGGGGGGTEKIVNPNLLLMSLFIKPFVLGALNKDAGVNFYNLEALDTYYFAAEYSGVNRVWLPFQGVTPGDTYTLSCYLRKRPSANSNSNYYVLLVPNYVSPEAAGTYTNSIARTFRVGAAGTYNLGFFTVNTGADWDWVSLTFTIPTVLERDISEYMLMLLCDQSYMYTDTYVKNHAIQIYQAKLEKGSEMTDWCLGEGQTLAGDFEKDAQGRITKTKRAVISSNIGSYDWYRCLYAPLTRLFDVNSGIIEVLSKNGDPNYDQKHQINIHHNIAGKGTSAKTVKFATRSDTGALEITAPGGIYINNKLLEL